MNSPHPHARRNVLLCLLLALAASGFDAHAQQQQQQPSPPQNVNAQDSAPRGSITGRVLGEDGQPVANVTVIAFTQGGMRTNGTSASASDAQGRFTLSNLEPAAYNINAFAPGYMLDEDFLADPSVRNYYHLGDSVTLRLVKGGIITGTVTNATGEPLVGAPVAFLRVRELDGRPVRDVRPGGSSRQRATDDRGVYRAYGLRPGGYIISVGGKPAFSFNQPTAYDTDAPTYYPAATRDTAVEVLVQAGQEMSGIDIRHRGEPGRTVSGTLASGQPLGGVHVVMLKHAASSAPDAFAYLQPGASDGGFAFEGVADGDYDISAQAVSSVESNAAAPPRRVSVRGADVTGVSLTLAPLGSIAGRLVFDPAPKPAPDGNACPNAPLPRPAETVVFARHDEDAASASRQPSALLSRSLETLADAAGEFQIRALEAGRYRPAVRLPDEDFYLRALTLPATAAKTATPAAAAVAPNANQAARGALILPAGERLSGLVINIGRGAARVRGRVAVAAAATDGASLPPDAPLLLPPLLRVHLVPAEREQADNLLRYAEAAVLADGTFTLEHLAPGRYFILARRADKERAQEAVPRPLAWTAGARAALRREAESANLTLDLAPCQRLDDYVLRFAAK